MPTDVACRGGNYKELSSLTVGTLWIHYVHEPNRQTHSHGWCDAPGVGLAVTETEVAVVPATDGRSCS